ncbi:diguanylate cyclase domain-containing protein [Photobacterium sanguinicancri]|uniref:diguanylate cyclase domain-containing protein n=1 Tax=Photobacterium sanguinicancri TaxID=875932 RepID=UPI0021C44C4B|nr:diguanylate cyclase [Photobacterium sanguinicancri]
MRNKFRNLSIRRKMTLPVSFILVLMFCAFSLFSVFSIINTEQDNLLARSVILGKGVAINLKAALLFDDQRSGDEILSAFQADNMVNFVDVTKVDGSVFASYRSFDEQNECPHIEDNFLLLGKTHIDHSFSSNFLYVSIPVTVAEMNVATMEICTSLDELHQAKNDMLKFCLLLLVPVFFLRYFLLKQLQVWVINPVESLSFAMQSLTKIRLLKQRPVAHGDDEIGSLVKCFNEMLDNLDERDKQISASIEQVASEKSFADDVISTVQHALLVLDNQGRILLANSACDGVFGCVVGDIRGLTLRTILTERFWVLHDETLKKILETDCESFDEIIKALDLQGSPRYYSVKARALVERNQVLIAIEDVTQKYLAEKQQRLAARIFEQSREGIIVIDYEGCILMVNSALSSIMGYEADELMGAHINDFLEIKYIYQIHQTIEGAGGRWRGEISEKHKNGTMIPLEVRANVINGSKDESAQIVMSITDLSHKKELEQLEYLAHHDALTGLANRKRLFDVLEQKMQGYLENQIKFAVLYIDLDGFKPVNDTYGHHIGDEVLKRVARRMEGSVRESDFVARLAGDEFVVLVDSVQSPEGGMLAAEQVFAAINAPMSIEGNALEIGASIGFSVVHGEGQVSIEEVLQNADAAMYRAKENNQHGIVCSKLCECKDDNGAALPEI